MKRSGEGGWQFRRRGASTSRGRFGTLYQSLRADWSIVTLFDSAGNKKTGSEEPVSVLQQCSVMA
jgi:hypothetical protein